MIRLCSALIALSLFMLTMVSSAAQAAVVYDNLNLSTVGGDCSFSTTCAVAAFRGDDYAAQEFTLGAGTVLRSASFSELNATLNSTSIKYLLFSSLGDAPGSILASGSSNYAQTTSGPNVDGDSVASNSFNLGAIALGAGTYFLAIQAVSSIQTFFQEGLSGSGAFETHDGGVTYSPFYAGLPSISISLSDSAVSAVPLPASAPLFGAALFGLAGIGYVAKRKKTAVAA